MVLRSSSSHKRRIQQRDVAERAGVSVSTVSRVLNNLDGISDSVRERVWKAAEELGYQSRLPYNGLSVNQVGVFAAWRQVQLSPFYADILAGAEAECRRIDANLTYSIVTTDEAGLRQLQDKIQKQHIDSAIMLALDDGEWLERVLALDFPVVVVNSEYPLLPVDTFLPDNRVGPRLAMEHFIAKGHRRIAYLTSFNQRTTLETRRTVYRQVLEENGIPFDPDYLLNMETRSTFITEDAYQFMRDQLAQVRPDYTALLCANDSAAIGVMRALQEAGYRVPDDISLIGYDDLPMAAFTSPPLTTVRIEREELGRLAVRRLVDRVKNPDLTPIRVELATRLIIRQSVADMRT